MSITLPTRPNVPQTGFPQTDSWLLYGQPKIGKTTLASNFPQAIILDMEGGASRVDCHVLPIKSMEDLRDAYDALEADNGKNFKTVVLDSIDIVYDWVEIDTCDFISKKMKTKVDNIGEAPMGSDWAEARKRLLGIVEVWQSLPITKVFLAHAKAVQGEAGTQMQKAKTLDLPGKLSHRFPARVDNIGFCYATKAGTGLNRVNERFVSFAPYDELEAGSRSKELEGKVLPMDFKAIRACFEGVGAQTLKKKLPVLARK